MKAGMRRRHRRFPPLSKGGVGGSPLEHRRMRPPDLPSREPGITRLPQNLQKPRILQRLTTGEGTSHVPILFTQSPILQVGTLVQ